MHCSGCSEGSNWESYEILRLRLILNLQVFPILPCVAIVSRPAAFLEKEKFMSNTQDRVLGRLNALELGAKELEAVAGGFIINTGVCTVGPAPQMSITTDGDCPG